MTKKKQTEIAYLLHDSGQSLSLDSEYHRQRPSSCEGADQVFLQRIRPRAVSVGSVEVFGQTADHAGHWIAELVGVGVGHAVLHVQHVDHLLAHVVEERINDLSDVIFLAIQVLAHAGVEIHKQLGILVVMEAVGAGEHVVQLTVRRIQHLVEKFCRREQKNDFELRNNTDSTSQVTASKRNRGNI